MSLHSCCVHCHIGASMRVVGTRETVPVGETFEICKVKDHGKCTAIAWRGPDRMEVDLGGGRVDERGTYVRGPIQ